MATYKKDKGLNVKSYTADPDKTYPSAFEGNLYYNSSDGQFKYIGLGAGAWASGGNMNLSKKYDAGCGTTTAACNFGGRTHPPEYQRDEMEIYNGTTWSEDADLNTRRDNMHSASGTSTDTMASGGFGYPNTHRDAVEQWDGSSWTEIAEFNTDRRSGAFTSPPSGTSTDALSITGNNSAANVEQWNGSAWTELTDVNSQRIDLGRAGTTTAALIMGGESPTANVAIVESWNGSTWTETTDMNSAKRGLGSGGTQTAALGYGRVSPDFSGITESWDGSAWTEIADMATARGQGGSSGVATGGNTDAIASGGGRPATSNLTEEFTFSHAFKKVTTS